MAHYDPLLEETTGMLYTNALYQINEEEGKLYSVFPEANSDLYSRTFANATISSKTHNTKYMEKNNDSNLCNTADETSNGLLCLPALQKNCFFSYELIGDNHVRRWITSTQHLSSLTSLNFTGKVATSSLTEHTIKNTVDATNAHNINNNDNCTNIYDLWESELEEEQLESQPSYYSIKNDNYNNNNNNPHENNDNENNDGYKNSMHLLNGANIKDLLQQVYSELAQCELEQMQLGEQSSKSMQKEYVSKFVEAATLKPRIQEQTTNELWVNKYAPRVFRDILIDDNISLRLLQWLKSWDAYVFGLPEAHSNTLKNVSSSNSNNNQTVKVNGVQHLKRARNSQEHETNTTTTIDSAQPFQFTSQSTSSHLQSCSVEDIPEPRLIVLTGPPGVGKTSLVHVLASHCHYGVIEINASADRTTGQLENALRLVTSPLPPSTRLFQRTSGISHNYKLKPENFANTIINSDNSNNIFGGHEASEMMTSFLPTLSTSKSRSLLEHLAQPKLLLIDEIDGIAHNVAEFIVSELIHKPIYRPVICCCNDWYAPSLRQLRTQVTHVYRLPPLSTQKIAFRLEEILAKELTERERERRVQTSNLHSSAAITATTTTGTTSSSLTTTTTSNNKTTNTN